LGLGSCEGTSSVIESSSHQIYFTVYVSVLIVYADQETLVDNSVYKIIRRIALSIVTKYQNIRCLLSV